MLGPQLLEIVSERGLAVAIESLESLLSRAVEQPKVFDDIFRTHQEVEVDLSTNELEIAHAVPESFTYRVFVAPEHRRSHSCRRRNILACRLEHLADEALR